MPARPAARLRYAGLGATTLLAIAAFVGGALPDDNATGVPAAAAIALAATGAVVLAVVWWHLPRAGVSSRWLLHTGALWAVPLLVAPPLASRDIYAYACQGALYLDGLDPYAVGAAGGCPWVDAAPPVWRDSPAPYGPLAIVLSGLAVALARALAGTPHAELLVAVGLLRAVAVGGVLLVVGYGLRLARLTTVDTAGALWLGVVTPLVAVHAVSGGHNDALLAGLTVAGLTVAASTRAAPKTRTAPKTADTTAGALLAGVVLGLAAAVKVTAVVAVPFAVLLVAGTGAWRPIRRATGLVVGGAVAAFGGLTAVAGLDLGWLSALPRTGSLVQWTSLPTGIGMAVGYLLRVLGWPQGYEEAVAVARIVGLAALAGVLVWLWWKAKAAAESARAVVAGAGAALAVTAVLAPVFYPWYAVVPLAVLAMSIVDARQRRAIAAVTVALVFLVLPDGLGLAVLTKLPGALLDVAIAGALLWWLVRRRRAAPTIPTATE